MLPPPTPPLPPPSGENGIITSVPGPGAPTVPPPPGAEPPRFVDPQPSARGSQRPKLIIAVLVACALAGGILALVVGGDDEETADPSVTTVVSSVDSTTASTDEPTTTAANTTPSTVVESTATPTTSPFVGPGAVFVLSDPLPSGLSADRADDALPQARVFADRLAASDYAGVNRMLASPGPPDEQLEASFGSIDRFSLIVIDASDDGFAVTLQLLGVANEADGSTSVRCLRWSVSPDGVSTGDVFDPAIIGQWDEQLTPESLFADSVLMDGLRAQCPLA